MIIFSWALFIVIFGPAVWAAFSLGHRKGHRCSRGNCWVSAPIARTKYGSIRIGKRF